MKVGRVLLAAVVLSIAVAVSPWAIKQVKPLLPQFREVIITGDIDVEAIPEVQAAVAASIDGSLITQDLEKIRHGVESVSWVRTADVRRVWPQSLSVSVTRHRPAAVFEDGRLVSTEGVLYSENNLPLEKLIDLPSISGHESYVAAVARNLPGLQEAAREIRSQLKTVNVTYRGSWSVTLESQDYPAVTVELGRSMADDLPVVRLRQVARYFFRVSDMMQGYPEKVDARYSDGFAAQIPSVSSNERWLEGRGGGRFRMPRDGSPREGT